MKKNAESDIREEYDLAGARPLRYGSGLSDRERRDLVRSSAVGDAAQWLVHTLRRVQELEARIVAYVSLAFERTPEGAGEAAIALLEGRDESTLSRLVSHAGPEGPAFEKRLRRVLAERTWLVHKGSLASGPGDAALEALSAFVARLEALTADAAALDEILRASLDRRMAEQGLSADEVQRRTEEAVGRWLAA